MICAEVRTLYDYNKPLQLIPFSDLHYKSAQSDIRTFRKDLKRLDDPHTYGVGNGDFFDLIVFQDKRYTRSSDGTVTSTPVDEAREEITETLRPYAKKILGLGIGNHEWEYIKRGSHNPTRVMCKELGIPYLGYAWFLRWMLSDQKGATGSKSGRGRTVVIRGHHGWGSGRTRGRDLTSFARSLESYEADIFLFGHTHRRNGEILPRLGLVGKTIVEKPIALVVCGTYQRTLSDTDDPTWAETRDFGPVRIGPPTLEIDINNAWLDMELRI